MAKKRNTGSDSGMSTGAAAVARRTTRKHAARPAAETSASTESNLTTQPAESAMVGPEVSATAPAFEDIARLAYSYWLERGGQGGSPEDDWLRAEQELRNSASHAANA